MSARGMSRRMSRGGCVAVALAAGLAAASLSGCGGDKDDGASAPIAQALATTTTSAPSAQATPAQEPFPGQPAQQIFMSAANAMKGLRTATVEVTGPDGDSMARAKFGMTDSGDCAGHTLINGGDFELISHGRFTYMKGDRAAWISQLGATKGAALDTALRGRWAKLPSSTDLGIASVCDLSAYTMDLTNGGTSADQTRGRYTTVNGQGAVPVTGPQDGGGTVTLYVATDGAPYVLKVVRTGSDPDTETLTDFDKPVGTNPPPASQTVDLSALHQPNGDGFSI